MSFEWIFIYIPGLAYHSWLIYIEANVSTDYHMHIISLSRLFNPPCILFPVYRWIFLESWVYSIPEILISHGRCDCDMECVNFKHNLIDCYLGCSSKHHAGMNVRGSRRWYVNTVSGNGLVAFGNKLLTESMLTKISDAIWRYQTRVTYDFLLETCIGIGALSAYTDKLVWTLSGRPWFRMLR